MAVEKLQVYKCEVCGNEVELIHAGGGELVCCNQPMKLYQENTVDAAVEKHVPMVEKLDDGFHVNVGDVVAIRARQNRMVDDFLRIVRKCNEPPAANEPPEWDIGCQSVSEFGDDGYGGNKYYWTGF